MRTDLRKSKRCQWIAGAALLLACGPEAVSATAVYAVTTGGALYRSTDGAATWQPVPIPGAPAVVSSTSLAIHPSGNIYLTLLMGSGAAGKKAQATSTPELFRSADGGQTWSQSDLPSTISKLLAANPTAPNIIYANSSQGLVRSTDSGATFGSSTLGLAVSGIGFDPQQPGVVYATAFQQDRNLGLFKSTDYGSAWTPLGSLSGAAAPAGPTRGGGGASTLPLTQARAAFEVAVDPRNSNVLYVPVLGTCAAGITNCGLVRSADGGKTWEAVNTPGNFYNVVFDSRSGAIYAAGMARTGQVAKSTDGGKTWTPLTTGLPAYAVVVHMDPNVSSTLYAAPAAGGLSPGGVWVSVNSGAAWKLSPVAPQSAPNDVIVAMGAASGTPPPAPAVPSLRNVSAASLRGGPLAPESLATALGAGLANVTATADGDPPLTLGGTAVSILDSAGATWQAPLIYVSPGKINYLIPAGVALGAATVTVAPSSGAPQSAQIQIASVAPGVFTLNDAGLVMATVLRTSGDQQTYEDVYQLDPTGATVARPIDMGPDTDQLSLIISGTGFRAAGTSQTSVTINGVDAPVSFAGAQGTILGVDQATVSIPRSLAGSGSVDLVLTAAGQTANTVKISFQQSAAGGLK
jgi:uncharacterized protein (TIGR03437 family)